MANLAPERIRDTQTLTYYYPEKHPFSGPRISMLKSSAVSGNVALAPNTLQKLNSKNFHYLANYKITALTSAELITNVNIYLKSSFPWLL